MTPAQLYDRLASRGINRNPRVLTDWLKKGLLPPLRRVGLGRGKGTRRFWDHDVVEQAIAAHCLLMDYARAEDAVLRLWLSGYRIDANRAKDVWGEYLQRQRNAIEKETSNSPDGYLRVGRHFWRALGKPESLQGSVADMLESLFDDSKRDDEGYRAISAWIINGAPEDGTETLSGDDAYRLVSTILSSDRRGRRPALTSETSNAVREAIHRLLQLVRAAIDYIRDDEDAPHDRAYKTVDRSWEKFGSEKFLVNREAIDFVQSMTAEELNTARESLAAIRSIIRHCVELTGPVERTASIRVQIALMGSLGHYFAPQIIALRRLQPSWPIAETILAIHDFVMHVQSTDIARKDNNKYAGSEQVINQWTTAQENLSRLWSAVKANTQN